MARCRAVKGFMLDGHSLIVEHVSEIAVAPEDAFDALGDASILAAVSYTHLRAHET